MKRFGFTGTQQGMTDAQKTAVRQLFRDCSEVIELHHGDCIGADADAHAIFESADGERVVIHPPDNPSKRAWCRFDMYACEIRRELPYLTRNKNIVDSTELLIACPSGPEVLRSGTWATVRYARKLGVPITIVWPNGSIQKENH